MKKKIFIDLNGIVFEPIDTNFSEIARQDFGPAKAMAVTMAYKYGIGRGMLKSSIARVLYNCARRPRFAPVRWMRWKNWRRCRMCRLSFAAR